MRLRVIGTIIGAGFLHGAWLYGVPLSALHVVHSSLDSPRDALVMLAWLALLFGALSALLFLLVGSVWVLVCPPRMDAPAPARGAAAAGVFVFTLLYWTRYLNLGLTYGEVPLVLLRTPAGMLAWVALRTALVAVVALLMARPIAALLVPHGRRRLWPGITLVLAVVALHLGLPTLAPARPPAAAATDFVPPRVAPTDLRVVLVGLDGMDWQVLDPLLAGGRLPAFAHLIAAGVSGPLTTIPDANSSELWASIYTGKESWAHGIEDFTRLGFPGMRAPGLFPMYSTYVGNLAALLERVGLASREQVHRDALHAPPLWEILLASGVSVGIIDAFYFSYPAPLLTEPSSYVLAYGVADEVRRLARPNTGKLAAYVQPAALVPEVVPHLGADEVEWQSRATLDLLRRRPQPRFLHVYTREPDQAQHLFWKWYQPEYFLRVAPEEIARYHDVIPALYERLDGFLGELVGLVGPETVVIVISDHGHSPTMLHPSYSSHHQYGPPGIMVMAGGPVVAGVRIADAHILDLLPTILQLLGLPVAADMPGRVLTEALDPAFAAAHPVSRIASYDGSTAHTRYADGSGEGTHDADEVGRLRALGYIQ